jgi:hypothetical protein
MINHHQINHIVPAYRKADDPAIAYHDRAAPNALHNVLVSRAAAEKCLNRAVAEK